MAAQHSQHRPSARLRASLAPAWVDAVAGSVIVIAALAALVLLESPSIGLRFAVGAAVVVVVLVGVTFRRYLERSKVEAELTESEARFWSLFDNSDDFVFSCDLDGSIRSINEAGVQLCGHPVVEIDGMHISQVFVLDRDAIRNDDQTDVWDMLSGAPGPHELDLLTRGGHRVPVEVRTQVIYRKNEQVGVQGIARDMQERQRFGRQLLHLANHDPLTELFNRGRFEQELNLQLIHARRHGTIGAVIFLDLDHFKDVNDTLGHAAGDQLLVALSQRINAGISESDIAARLGGDEFTIIIPETDHAGAVAAANTLLEGIRRETFGVAGQEFSVTASAGIAMIRPDSGDGAAELLSHADLAMYQAKEKGRNTVCTYEEGEGMEALVNSNFGWRRRIWEAFEQERFTLFAQPMLDLRNGQDKKFELLLRLRETNGEIIDAGSFVARAERFGLMPAIDRWVLRKAIALLSEHSDLMFSVNLSSRALSDDELLPLIRGELAANAVDPSRLIIEVTESAAMENVHAAQQFVSELKELGCRFALDDFGAGFSSFYHLKMLDVDYLKIDGSLVRDLPRDSVDQHLVKAIVEVARALDKEVIAEFVTDAATLEIVRFLGVDYAQGYHVGRPADLETLIKTPALARAA